jgi:hypothetical protein
MPALYCTSVMDAVLFVALVEGNDNNFTIDFSVYHPRYIIPLPKKFQSLFQFEHGWIMVRLPVRSNSCLEGIRFAYSREDCPL